MVAAPPVGVPAAFGLSFSISDPKGRRSAPSAPECDACLRASPPLCHQTALPISGAELPVLVGGVLGACLLCWPWLRAEAASCMACTAQLARCTHRQASRPCIRSFTKGENVPSELWTAALGSWPRPVCQSPQPKCVMSMLCP